MEIMLVLLGAAAGGGFSLLTTLMTHSNDKRIRMFEIKRTVYAEALRSLSVARYALGKHLTPDHGFAPTDMSQIVAQLELIGSPNVHTIFITLWYELQEAFNVQEQAATNDGAAVRTLFDLLERITADEDELISRMRSELGGRQLRVSPGSMARAVPPSQ